MKTRLAFVLTILSVTAVWAQLPTSMLNISNLRLDSANVARFDVYWKNTSAGQIEYASGQYFFDFNKEVLNDRIPCAARAPRPPPRVLG